MLLGKGLTELAIIGICLTVTTGDLLSERATVKRITGDAAGFGRR